LIGALIAVFVVRCLRSPQRTRLDEVVALPGATESYLRVFVLAVVFFVLAAVTDPAFTFKDTVRPVEYVWVVKDREYLIKTNLERVKETSASLAAGVPLGGIQGLDPGTREQSLGLPR